MYERRRAVENEGDRTQCGKRREASRLSHVMESPAARLMSDVRGSNRQFMYSVVSRYSCCNCNCNCIAPHTARPTGYATRYRLSTAVRAAPAPRGPGRARASPGPFCPSPEDGQGACGLLHPRSSSHVLSLTAANTALSRRGTLVHTPRQDPFFRLLAVRCMYSRICPWARAPAFTQS